MLSCTEAYRNKAFRGSGRKRQEITESDPKRNSNARRGRSHTSFSVRDVECETGENMNRGVGFPSTRQRTLGKNFD